MSNHGDRPSMPSAAMASAGMTFEQFADGFRTFVRNWGLQTAASRLQIAFVFDTTDPHAIAEQFHDHMLVAIVQQKADEAGQAAQITAHYAELADRGCRFAGAAELTGGPRDRQLREDCHHEFRVRVHQIVRRAGFLVSEEEAFQSISECLRRGKYKFRVTNVEDACEAAALLCDHFDCLTDDDVRKELAFAFGSVREVGNEAPALPPIAEALPEISEASAATNAIHGAQEAAAEAASLTDESSTPQGVAEGVAPQSLDSANAEITGAINDEVASIANPPFPNRAAKLRAHMDALGIGNEHDFEELGGPSYKTTKRVLAGLNVYKASLDCIHMVLRNKGVTELLPDD